MTQTEVARPLLDDRSIRPAAGTKPLSTVIASVPGIAEQSLRATLASLPAVEMVGCAAGCLSALHLVRERQADLVVMDSNLPFEDVRVFLQQLQQDGLRTRSLVLATTDGQVRRALAAGADAALRRDASIVWLEQVVDRLHRTNPGEAGQASDERR